MIGVTEPGVIGTLAAMEVLVHALVDEAVPTLDGGLQGRGIDVDQPRQLFNGVGLLEIALLGPGVGLLGARHGAGQHVILDKGLIEDRPAGDGGNRLVPLEHGLAIELVGAAFVHVANARLVHEDGVRLARQALGGRCREHGLPAWRQGGLVADHLVHLGQDAANALHLDMHLAHVALVGLRPFALGAGHVLVAHGLVASKAAGIDQHAQLGADAPGLAVLHGHHACHRAVLDDEFRDGRLQAHIHPSLQACLQHPPLQGGAGPEDILARQLSADSAQDHLQERFFAGPALLKIGQLKAFIEPRWRGKEAWTQLGLPLAQFVGVEELGRQAARGFAAARKFVVVVRPEVGAALELQTLIDQEVDHLGGFMGIGQAALARGARSRARVGGHHRVHIVDRCFCAVLVTRRAHEAVVGDPHHAARLCSRAASPGRLFQDHNGLARLAHDQRRTHRAGAVAHDHPIERLVKCGHARLSRFFRARRTHVSAGRCALVIAASAFHIVPASDDVGQLHPAAFRAGNPDRFLDPFNFQRPREVG